MRRAILTLGVAVLTGLSFSAVGAQEVEQEVTLTGCLAEETEGDEIGYVLTPIEGQDVDVDIEALTLVAGEDVNLAPHVGHTVEATGEWMAHGDGPALRVTRLGHLSATCDPAGGG